MKELYIGIDVHLKQHVVSMISTTKFHDNNAEWKRTKSIKIGNNRSNFENLDFLIKSQAKTNQVSIAIDHTGKHYSEPISYFLKSQGYDVYYLEAGSVKTAKERLLGEENKTDKLDSVALAYLLYLRDFYKVSLHISATSANFDSQSSLMRSLLLQSQYYRKLGAQTTNRLRQYVHAVFPEGEENYFNQLLKILPQYPTPEDIINNPYVFNKSRLSLILVKRYVNLPKRRSAYQETSIKILFRIWLFFLCQTKRKPHLLSAR